MAGCTRRNDVAASSPNRCCGSPEQRLRGRDLSFCGKAGYSNRLKRYQEEIGWIEIEVTLPEPLGFRSEAKEPLEAYAAHPVRSLLNKAGQKRKGCTHCQNRHGKHVLKLKGKGLLARTSEADQRNRRSRCTNLFGEFKLLIGREPPEFGRLCARNYQLRTVDPQAPLHLAQDLRSAAVQKDRHSFLSGTITEPPGKARTPDPIGQPRRMKPVQNPADRLAVGDQDIKMIETKFVLAIEHTGHDSMNGQRRNNDVSLFTCRSEDVLKCSVVVNGVDHYSENVLFS